MEKKIILNKNKVVVFMGGMNAMPMMYAIELKKLGYEVIYFVDVAKKDTLSRPENHFPDINYPYPGWIVEWIIPSQILLSLFPKLFAALYKRKIKQLTKKDIGCFILNGFFSSLAPYFNKHSSKVALSHGSDLDVWANIDGVEALINTFNDRSIFKYLPKSMSRILIKKIVEKQFYGFENSNTVVYFPTGFNAEGDKVVKRLESSGVTYVPRYDISFDPLVGQSRKFKNPSKILEIFSGVRFLFKTFPDGNTGYNKGNDLIIKGIAKYRTINPNIRVHFVEKGEDVHYAKELCRELAINDIVVWHKEMKFKELLALYHQSDLCFDQMGEHWIGAIGGYALWLGKPLIANSEPAVRAEIWPINNPVCCAKTAAEISEWLIRLEDAEFRETVSMQSKKFVEEFMAPKKALNAIFNLSEK